jgi:uncharacterized protein
MTIVNSQATRRSVLLTASASVLAQSVRAGSSAAAEATFESKRPPQNKRNFSSPAVEKAIVDTKRLIADPELAWLFENCFPNTLDTTVKVGTLNGKADTFVITGDIDAMWLRDSTAQVWPYLPLLKDDPSLRQLVAGLINRQVWCVQTDPYANAFNFDGSKPSHWASDRTDMKNELHERKWEIDSLCYPVRLSYGYWKATGDVSLFDDSWKASMATIIKTFRDQQRLSSKGAYKFQRKTTEPGDTLTRGGLGAPTRSMGLIHSGFRPSDDACVFPFLIPSNFFAASVLGQMAELAQVVGDKALQTDALGLRAEVQKALSEHALKKHPHAGSIWAFEVDGYGNALFIDDANVPSLLSLPYLGICKPNDPTYQRTRKFVLSDDNPYFSRGKAADGIGGPHVGPGMIWPMGLVMRALTSTNDAEILQQLRWLKSTHANTGFMHEAFWKDDSSKFTRPWFSWANTLFGELILTLAQQRPHLLRAAL